jgi:hypothetical protein
LKTWREKNQRFWRSDEDAIHDFDQSHDGAEFFISVLSIYAQASDYGVEGSALRKEEKGEPPCLSKLT